jgi:6-phosphogluconolactonase (cycloisomerase 2 family)
VTLGTGTNPAGIPPSTARFSFVSNDDPATSLYTVNPANGQWRTNGYVASGTTNNNAPGQVTIHPNNQFAYIPNIQENTVSLFAMGTNGFLTPLTPPSIASGMGPAAAGITPNGQFFYVANAFDNTISGYSVNGATGLLTSLGPSVPAGQTPVALAIDPSGSFLYVANADDSSISAFAINGGTGALAIIPGSPVTTGLTPVSARVDAKGRLLVVANFDGNTITTFAINAMTGALNGPTTIPVGNNPEDATLDLSGKFLYVANNGSNTVSAFAIATSGALSTVAGSPFSMDPGPSALAVDPSGQFLYVGSDNIRAVTAYQIDPNGGGLTKASTIQTRATPVALTIVGGATGVTYMPTFAYVSNEGSNDVSAYSVNPTTGVLTAIAGSPYPTKASPSSITVERTGRFVYTANSGTANTGLDTDKLSGFAADTNNGSLTPLSPLILPYFTLVGGPKFVAADVSGRNLYLATNSTQSVVTYSIDPVTGVLIDRSGNAGCGNSQYNSTSALAVDPIGRGGYRANLESNTLCIQNIIYPIPGIFSSLGIPDVPTGTSPSSIAIDPTGRYAYVANQVDNSISAYRVSSTDLNLTLIGTVSSNGTSPSALALEPTGRFLYVTNQVSGSIATYGVSSTTGTLAAVGTIATGLSPRALAIDPRGQFVYVTNGGSNTISIYSADANSGQLTPMGTVASGTNPSSIAIAYTIQ